MKIKLSWQEFVEAARIELSRRFNGLTEVSFHQVNWYEPDSECYNSPPAYVEITIDDGK